MQPLLSFLFAIWFVCSCASGTFVSYHGIPPDNLSRDDQLQIVKESLLLVGANLVHSNLPDFCNAKGVPEEQVLEWRNELRGELLTEEFVLLETQVCLTFSLFVVCKCPFI